MYEVLPKKLGRPPRALAKILLIMRLTTLLLITAILQVSASSHAQKISLAERNASLTHVLERISAQTGFDFLYESAKLKDIKNITIDVQNEELKDVLSKVLEPRALEFTIEDNSVIIKEKEPSLASVILKSVQDLFQSIDVRGRVVDENGEPLVGATVRVKVSGSDTSGGKNKQTTTNDKGEFFLSGVDEDAVITVNFIGYKVLEVKATGNVGDLRMEVLAAELKEVAISTGYQQISPEKFIGSAVVIDSTILERQVGRNLFDRLDGATNGLLFNKSNFSTTIQLRGISTLNNNPDLNGLSSQTPLIILDDFPYAGDINTINPNDIETVSILKDAVATSIWGARAGNGVIVIKSKAPKKNQKAIVSFSSNIGISEKPNLNYFPQLSSSEYIDVEQFLFDKGYYNTFVQYPQFFKTSPIVEILDKIRKDPSFGVQGKTEIDALRNIDYRDDLNRYVYRNGINHQNFLSLSQGSDLINYRVSLGANNNLSDTRGPGRTDRYTLNSYVSFRPIKALELSVGLDYANDKLKGIGNVTNLLPYNRLADDDGNSLAIPYALNVSYLETLPKDKLLDWQYRPLDELQLINNTIINNSLRIDFGANLKIAPWLTGILRYQNKTQKIEGRNNRSIDSYFTRNEINRFTNPTTFVRAIPVGNILDLSSNKLESHNLRGQLNVNKKWNSIHDFNALLSGEFSTTSLNGGGYRLYGYNDNTGTFNNLMDFKDSYPLFSGGSGRIPSDIFNASEKINNLVSVLGNASYTYDQRYGVYASARRDGTNLIGVATNNKFKPLWSAGARWNISNEYFYQLEWIPNLSFRVTYGYAGNVNNTISGLSLINYGSNLNNFGQTTAGIFTVPNPDLRWEKVRTLNFGVDFGTLNNRVTGNFEWWTKKSTDVIAHFPVDPTLGVNNSLMARNAANLAGEGLDLTLNTSNIIGKFQWKTTFNLNYSKTVVTRYHNTAKNTPNAPIIREGDIYNAIYAYKWAGLDPQNGDPRGYVNSEISKNYQNIFNDDVNNQTYIGSEMPLYYGNLMNTFSCFGISLSANISFRADYYFRKPSVKYEQLFTGKQFHSDYRMRWQKPGDENITNVPSMTYPFNANRDRFYEFSEVNYERGDHIRLQDIHLNYRWINKNKKIPFKSITFNAYLSNINVFIWKFSDHVYDPDYPTNVFPPRKSYALGLNINL